MEQGVQEVFESERYLDYLKANAPSLATPVLCTELEDDQRIRLLKEGPVKAGEPLFEVEVLN